MILDDLETKKVLLAALEERRRRVEAIGSAVVFPLFDAYFDAHCSRRFIRLLRLYSQANSALYKAIRHYRLSIVKTQQAALLARDSKGRFIKKK